MFLNKLISKKNTNTVTGTAKAASIIIIGKKLAFPYDINPIRVGIYAIKKNINILKHTHALAFVGSIFFISGVVFSEPQVNNSSNSSSECFLKVFLNKSLNAT